MAQTSQVRQLLPNKVYSTLDGILSANANVPADTDQIILRTDGLGLSLPAQIFRMRAWEQQAGKGEQLLFDWEIFTGGIGRNGQPRQPSKLIDFQTDSDRSARQLRVEYEMLGVAITTRFVMELIDAVDTQQARARQGQST